MNKTGLFSRRAILTAATIALAGTLAACGGSSNTDTGAAAADFSAGATPIQNSGIRWKPVSEHGALVVLTPSSFPAGTMKVYDKAGKLQATGNNTGRTNGDRYTYRFGQKGGSFPAPAVMELNGKKYLVASPGSNYNR